MRFFNSVLLVIFIALMMAGCDNIMENDANSEHELADGEYPYPLVAGNQWEFRREYKLVYYSDSTNRDSVISSTVGSDSIAVIVAGATTLQDSINTTEVFQEAWSDTLVNTSEYYYQQRDTGLFLIAYRHSYYPSLPKPTGMENYLSYPIIYDQIGKHNISISNTGSTDELSFIEPPRQILKYPLEIGEDWCYRFEPYKIDKKVIRDTTVVVPVGEFDCYQVRLKYYVGTWVTIDDFISDNGLVLRKITTEGSIMTSSYMVLNDEYKLMGYSGK